MSGRLALSVAVVWLDARQAKLFRFSADRMERRIFEVADGNFEDLSEALSGERRILVLGRGEALSRFRDGLQEKHPKTASCIVGVEEVDAPSDQQIAQYALQYSRRPLA